MYDENDKNVNHNEQKYSIKIYDNPNGIKDHNQIIELFSKLKTNKVN